MKKSLPLLAALLLAAPVFAQNAVVVNGKAIPSSKLDKLVKSSGQPDSPDLRDRARKMLIDRELLVQEANKRGLPAREDIAEQLEQARLNVLVGAVFEDYLQSSGALQEVYDKVKAQMGNGKEFQTRHILVETEDQAKAVIAKLKGGAKFEDLAKAESKDPGSAANGGDLGWAPAGTYVPEFTAAMNGLQKGQMTETPVKTQFGYHIIQVQDVRDAKMPSLEEVKPQLMQMLQQDQNMQRAKFEEMLKALRAKAKIQ